MSLVNGGSDLLTTNNNGNNLIKSLSYFPKTKKNEAIRTYIQQQVYLRHKEKYTEIIKDKPELCFISTVDEITGKPIHLKNFNVEKIEIEFPSEDISRSSLYSNKNIMPEKTFKEHNNNDNSIEGFDNQNQNQNNMDMDMNMDISKNCDTLCVFKYSSIALLIILVVFLILKLKK